MLRLVKPSPETAAALEAQRGDPDVIALNLRNCSTCFWLFVAGGVGDMTVACCVLDMDECNLAGRPHLRRWLATRNAENDDCPDYKTLSLRVERVLKERADADQSSDPEP